MHIHVFAIDILPSKAIVSSGGSLRSQQMIDGLRKAGAEVTYSIPRTTDAVKDHWDLLTAEERENAISPQPSSMEPGRSAFDLINRLKPDAAVYMWPAAYTYPKSTKHDMVTVFDMNGFQNVESAGIRGSSTAPITTEYLNKVVCGDVTIAGSEAQRAYWSGLYDHLSGSRGRLDMIEIPYCPRLPELKPYSVGEPTFFSAGSFLPWNSPEGHLEILASAIGRAGRGRLVIVGRANPMLPHAAKVNARLRALKEMDGVEVHSGMPYPEFSDLINGVGIGIDLNARTFEREFAIPIRTVTFLAHGVPMITNDYSAISAEIGRYKAGWQVSSTDDRTFRSTVDQILSGTSDSEIASHSANARRMIQERFDTTGAFRLLVQRIEEKRSEKTQRAIRATEAVPNRSSFLKPSTRRVPVVMIITDDHENFIQLRIRIPFDAMYRAGRIGGYIVYRLGKIIKTVGHPSNLDRFDVVWVQRGPSSAVDLVAEMFSGRYAYDIDDNLLVSPSYRQPFSQEWREVITGLMASAAAVTTTTPRLVDSLQRHSGIQIEHKVSLAPNLTDAVHPRMYSGAPEAVLLAASDSLPLIASRSSFFAGMNRFCDARGLPLVYIGTDSNSFPEVKGKVISTGFMEYEAYRTFLRSENVMAVAPLETRADFLTSEFINCKSDIKMVEFGAAGVPGVYSNAVPYSDSPLLAGPLVDCSDERSVVEALEKACDDADHVSRLANDSIAHHRLADGPAIEGWASAVERARLPTPVLLDHFLEVAQALRGRNQLTVAVPENLFDVEDYLALNPDVADQVQRGETTAYLHYLNTGARQGRSWFPGGTNADTMNLNLMRYRNFVLTEPGRLSKLEERLAKR